ncbi:MAG: acetolactate synthase-1/2/3 large subunit, partial [Myxococcota bacterium]
TRLQEVLPSETIYTSDIGEHLMFALHYLQVDHSDGFQAHLGLGSMGSGIGSAIGAKMAHLDRPVVSVCGDYGFQMFGMELATCVEYRIGVIFAVFNDSRMRMVEHGMDRLFGRPPNVAGPTIDYAAHGRALGAHGITIRNSQDFEQLTDAIANSTIPTVLDIRIDPNAAFAAMDRVNSLGASAGQNKAE